MPVPAGNKGALVPRPAVPAGNKGAEVPRPGKSVLKK